MIGRGRDRAPDLTFWEVDPAGDDDIWTEVPTPPFDRLGYKWLDSQTMRWGTNTIVDDLEVDPREIDQNHNLISTIEEVDVISFVTKFDEEDTADVTEFETHATLGDSGGAVFVQEFEGDWLLTGVIFAVTRNEGQPDRTAVFDNFTVAADLAFYRDQIIELVSAADPQLQAGDSDQNLSFDQLDLVKVLAAAKYLTGQAATWGDGDWNAAPGGSPGNPPVGDGLFDQFDIIASQQHGLYLQGPYAALQATGSVGDSQASVIYDAATGEVSIDAPANTNLTSVNLQSATGVFTGESAMNLGGAFDIDADASVFKATFGGSFGSLTFGRIAQPLLAEEFLRSDLTVTGSLEGGGGIGRGRPDIQANSRAGYMDVVDTWHLTVHWMSCVDTTQWTKVRMDE